MPNVLYTPDQVARVAVSLAVEESFLGSLISRNLENDLLGGGGKGRVVNLKVPAALVARSRDIDNVTDSIVLDNIAESTVPVELGAHIYSAVPLSEGDLSLDLASFSEQVLAVQTAAVVDAVENEVAKALTAITLNTAIRWDISDPTKTFTAIRKELRGRGVPATGLNVVVGTNVYAALLDAKAITDASQSGSTEALREAGVGRVRGFNIVESTRVGDNEIVAFHRDAFALAVRAPKVPEGAAFGATVNEGGYSLRYLRDYDVTKTVDRSLVSTFAGVAAMPLYKVTRNYTTGAATVSAVTGGAALRMSIGDAEPV